MGRSVSPSILINNIIYDFFERLHWGLHWEFYYFPETLFLDFIEDWGNARLS